MGVVAICESHLGISGVVWGLGLRICILLYILLYPVAVHTRWPCLHDTSCFAEYCLFYSSLLQKRPIAVLVRYVGVADLCKSGLGVWGGLEQ